MSTQDTDEVTGPHNTLQKGVKPPAEPISDQTRLFWVVVMTVVMLILPLLAASTGNPEVGVSHLLPLSVAAGVTIA